MVFGLLNSIKTAPPAKNLGITLPELTTDLVTNYGSNWTRVTEIPGVEGTTYAFLCCGISGLGQYQVVPTYNTNGIYVSNNYGVSWNLKNTADLYKSAYISYSGKYIFILTWSSKMYTSINFGVSFSVSTITPMPKYYFYSQDETYHGYISSTDKLNISSNSGTSFAIPSILTSSAISNAVFSQNGKYQLAIDGTSIYVSRNFGILYSSVASGLNLLPSVSMSLDGKYMFVTTNPTLKYSNDFGVTWNNSSGSVYSNILYCSYTGKYVCLMTSTNIYISSNYGVSFSITYTGSNIRGMKMSLDGKYLIMVNTSSTDVIISKNYGVSWTTTPTGMTASPNNNNWKNLDISADGKYMLFSTNIGTSGYTNYVYKSAN